MTAIAPINADAAQKPGAGLTAPAALVLADAARTPGAGLTAPTAGIVAVAIRNPGDGLTAPTASTSTDVLAPLAEVSPDARAYVEQVWRSVEAIHDSIRDNGAQTDIHKIETGLRIDRGPRRSGKIQ